MKIGSRAFQEAKRFVLEGSYEGESSVIDTNPYTLSISIGKDSFPLATEFSVFNAEVLSSLILGNNTFQFCEVFNITNPSSIDIVIIGDNVGGTVSSFVLNGVREFVVGTNSFPFVTFFSIGESTHLFFLLF